MELGSFNCTDYGFFLNDHPILYTEDKIPIQTLYVSRFGPKTPESTLEAYFTQFGRLLDFRLIRARKCYAYAFVTYMDAEDAAKVLKFEEHEIDNHFLKVLGADSWHQPYYVEFVRLTEFTNENPLPDDEPEIVNDGVSLLVLNDDCIFQILKFLDIFDLKCMEKVSKRLCHLTKIAYKHYKNLDFFNVKDNKCVTLMETRNILSKIGPYIVNINIPAVKFVTSNKRIIELIPRHCPNVKHLKLEGFHLPSTTLNKFADIFKKLISLELKSCGITEQIDTFLEISKNLEKLNLSHNFEISGKCLTKVNNLLILCLDNCVNLQPKFFSEFCQNNKTLKYLNISHCERLNETNVTNIIDNLVNLEHLVISNSYANIDNKIIADFAKLVNLKKLQVNFICFANINLLIEQLSYKNQLEYLDVTSCTSSGVSLQLLYKFTKLKHLKLNYRVDLNDETLERIVQSNVCLEVLSIAGCFRITEESLLRIILMCVNLHILDVSGCEKITDELIYNTINILKEGDRKNVLELVVGATQIQNQIIEEERVTQSAALLKISFENNYESHIFHSDNIFGSLLDNTDFDIFEDLYSTSDSDDDWL